MKLRIKGNSIRLRLLRSEVERFATEGRIVEDVDFGDSVLRYLLVMSPETTVIKATFENSEISVLVPAETARDWAFGTATGIETAWPLGNKGELSILIEKDFACLDRPDDPDRHDAFPNPGGDCAS